MNTDSRIFVAGHNGLVGSAIVRLLHRNGHKKVVLVEKRHCDLRNQKAVSDFFEFQHPEYVFIAAGRVGGIIANSTYPADFIYDNMMIEFNLLWAAKEYGVKKTLNLGTSCIYPKFASQPLRESSLMTGTLELTNRPYATAKIAGIEFGKSLRRQYGTNVISAMPTNLYGPNDNYHPENSHVIPGLIRRFTEARVAGLPEARIWGTGKPLREFMYADDLADACLFLMENYDEEEFINVGSGEEISILELSCMIADVVGFRGHIVCDESKPDGTPRKALESSRIRDMGWKPKVGLEKGLRITYKDFCAGGGRNT